MNEVYVVIDRYDDGIFNIVAIFNDRDKAIDFRDRMNKNDKRGDDVYVITKHTLNKIDNGITI